MKNIVTASDLQAIEGPVLIKFTASWCPPCKALQPILDTLEQEFGHACTFVQADIDEAEALSIAHGVDKIPYVKILDDNREIMAEINPSMQDMRMHLEKIAAASKA